jgi:hypothetical protein
MSFVRRFALAVVVGCGTLICIASPARSYTFGDTVTGGTPTTIFDGPGTCADVGQGNDFPDLAARAFHYHGQVQLLTGRYNTRVTAPTLAQAIDDDNCNRLLSSTFDGDPTHYNYSVGLDSPYVLNDNTIYALLHEEYHGSEPPAAVFNPDCVSQNGQPPKYSGRQCSRRSTMWAVSNDGGGSYATSPTPPLNLVSSLPYKFQAGWGSPSPGYVGPTNIVFNRFDGYYYTLFFAQGITHEAAPDNPPRLAQKDGVCVMRTPALSPGAWRAWGNSDGIVANQPAFDVRFVNPYTEPGYDDSPTSTQPYQHVCAPLPDLAGYSPHGLVYSTFFHKYMLIVTKVAGGDVYYSLSKSDNLTSWDQPISLMNDPKDGPAPACSNSRTVAYPSVIDPQDPSANFEYAGDQPYLYFVHWGLDGSCNLTGNRDMIRIPIQFHLPCTSTVDPGTAVPDPLHPGQNLGTIDQVGLEQYLNNTAQVPDGSVVCLDHSSYAADQSDHVLTLSRSNITVRNAPGQGVAIHGRIVLDGPRNGSVGANYVRFYGLTIDGAGGGAGATVTVTGHHDTIDRTTITNEHQGQSCIKAAYDQGLGVGPSRLTVANDRIYDCGTSDVGDHGVDINSGSGHIVTGNWIYENSGSGVRLFWNSGLGGPQIDRTTVDHNVIASNCATSASTTSCYGQASIVQGTNNSAYSFNTFAFPYSPPGNLTPPYNFYVTSGFGSNDVLADNCFWKPEGTDHTWVQLQNGITNTRPSTADPQFVDRTNVVHAYRNYSIPSGNACYSMQPSGTVGGGFPYAN